VHSRKATSGEVYFPLQFDPGEEAQVDWGEAWAVIGGVERKVSLFCMRLCYSKASFVRAYERETQEALLDGHVRAFAFFGGVPRRTAYDNLKAAVVSVGRGQDRRLTIRFRELRSHYLFETRFCNVACGHEKGHVENLVKHSQRTYMTPVPQMAGLETLNRHLLEQCEKDKERLVTRLGRTQGDLLVEEQASMLPLPERPFEACKRVSTFAGKQALVRFERNDYSVPVEYAYHPVVIKGFVDRVGLHVAEQQVAVHSRCYEASQYILDPYHYLPLLQRKPGGLHNARAFKGQPWGEDFERMRQQLEYRYEGEGTRKYIRILLFFTRFAVREVKEAVSVCVRRRAYSDEAVHSVLTYAPRRRLPSLDLSDRPDLHVQVEGWRPAGVYDALLAGEEVGV